jgi:hypothetical protein
VLHCFAEFANKLNEKESKKEYEEKQENRRRERSNDN